MNGEKRARRGGVRLIPHWIAWPLMFLGIWYLPLPLGGYYWSAYLTGIVLAVAYGCWAWRAFHVTVVNRSETATVVRIERVRGMQSTRIRKLLRVAVIAVVGLFALTALANQLLVKPRAAGRNDDRVPPRLNDSGPLPTVKGPSGESRIKPLFSHVASVISGFGTEVRCWSVGDWRKRTAEWGNWHGRPLGPWGAYTSRWRPPIKNAYRIHLSPSICASLDLLAYGKVPAQQSPWPEALAWSVSALAHESQHVRGIFNEAEAECYGVQAIEAGAMALGRTAAEGQFLARIYWTESYLHQKDPEYRSVECRDGGRLDMRPQSHVWP